MFDVIRLAIPHLEQSTAGMIINIFSVAPASALAIAAPMPRPNGVTGFTQTLPDRAGRPQDGEPGPAYKRAVTLCRASGGRLDLQRPSERKHGIAVLTASESEVPRLWWSSGSFPLDGAMARRWQLIAVLR